MILLPVKHLKVKGSPNFKNIDSDGYLNPDFALLNLDAAVSLVAAEDFFRVEYGVDLYFSGMFRPAVDQATLKRARGKYEKLPGYSGHNFGFSMDLHTNRIFAQFRCTQKSYSLRTLRSDLSQFGWTHIEQKMWHFDYLAGRASINEVIDQDFGDHWAEMLSSATVEELLVELGYQKGNESLSMSDTKSSLEKFQGDFGLKVTGKMDSHTRRVLLVATMKVTLI